MAQTQIGETDHFWYRLRPEGVYIDSQRDNKAFGCADGRIMLSEDNGHTWPHSLAFPDATTSRSAASSRTETSSSPPARSSTSAPTT